VGKMSGLGAGLDSFYEYMLKVKPTGSHSFILQSISLWQLHMYKFRFYRHVYLAKMIKGLKA